MKTAGPFKRSLLYKLTAFILLFIFPLTDGSATFLSAPKAFAQASALSTVKLSELQSIKPGDWVRNLELPEELGSIQSSYIPESLDLSEKPIVVHIQGAHAHAVAESNTQQMLAYLQKEYGLPLVMLEGGEGQLDPLFFRSFPDKELKEKLVNDYVRSSELTGGEAASILNEDSSTQYFGIENRHIYEANKKAFLLSLENNNKIEAKLNHFEQKLTESARDGLSDSVQKFLKVKKALTNEGIDLLDFAKALQILYKRHAEISFHTTYPELSKIFKIRSREKKLSAGAYDVVIKKWARTLQNEMFSKLSKFRRIEAGGLIQMHQTGQMDGAQFIKETLSLFASEGHSLELPKDLHTVTRHYEMLAEIESYDVFKELESLEKKLLSLLPQTEADHKVLRQTHHIELLRKLSTLELNTEDWKEIQSVFSTASDQDLVDLENKNELNELFRPHFRFYELARIRDQVMFKNMQWLIKKQNSKLAVVITGGFHTDGMSEMLREQKIPHVVVTPEMQTVGDRSRYVEMMKGNVSYMKYYSGNRWAALARDFSVKITEMMPARERGLGLKAWRDEIIHNTLNEERITEAGKYTQFVDDVARAVKHQGSLSENVFKQTQAAEEKFNRRFSAFSNRYFQKIKELFDGQLERILPEFQSLWGQDKISGSNVEQFVKGLGLPSASNLSLDLGLIAEPGLNRFGGYSLRFQTTAPPHRFHFLKSESFLARSQTDQRRQLFGGLSLSLSRPSNRSEVRHNVRQLQTVSFDPGSGDERQLVIIVGAGPAGIMAATELLKNDNVRILMIDRLPFPGGLGVTGIPWLPHDYNLKVNLWKRAQKVVSNERVQFLGNTDVGKDITREELEAFGAPIVVATGTPLPRMQKVPGRELKGIHNATNELFFAHNWEFFIRAKRKMRGLGMNFLPSMKVPSAGSNVLISGFGNVAGDVMMYILHLIETFGSDIRQRFVYRGPKALGASMAEAPYMDTIDEKNVEVMDMYAVESYGGDIVVNSATLRKQVITGFRVDSTGNPEQLRRADNFKPYKIPGGKSMNDVLRELHEQGLSDIAEVPVELAGKVEEGFGYRLDTRPMKDSERWGAERDQLPTTTIEIDTVFEAVGNMHEAIPGFDLDTGAVDERNRLFLDEATYIPLGQFLTGQGNLKPTGDTVRAVKFSELIDELGKPSKRDSAKTTAQVQKLVNLHLPRLINDFEQLQGYGALIQYFNATPFGDLILRSGLMAEFYSSVDFAWQERAVADGKQPDFVVQLAALERFLTKKYPSFRSEIRGGFSRRRLLQVTAIGLTGLGLAVIPSHVGDTPSEKGLGPRDVTYIPHFHNSRLDFLKYKDDLEVAQAQARIDGREFSVVIDFGGPVPSEKVDSSLIQLAEFNEITMQAFRREYDSGMAIIRGLVDQVNRGESPALPRSLSDHIRGYMEWAIRQHVQGNPVKIQLEDISFEDWFGNLKANAYWYEANRAYRELDMRDEKNKKLYFETMELYAHTLSEVIKRRNRKVVNQVVENNDKRIATALVFGAAHAGIYDLLSREKLRVARGATVADQRRLFRNGVGSEIAGRLAAGERVSEAEKRDAYLRDPIVTVYSNLALLRGWEDSEEIENFSAGISRRWSEEDFLELSDVIKKSNDDVKAIGKHLDDWLKRNGTDEERKFFRGKPNAQRRDLNREGASQTAIVQLMESRRDVAFRYGRIRTPHRTLIAMASNLKRSEVRSAGVDDIAIETENVSFERETVNNGPEGNEARVLRMHVDMSKGRNEYTFNFSSEVQDLSAFNTLQFWMRRVTPPSEDHNDSVLISTESHTGPIRGGRVYNRGLYIHRDPTTEWQLVKVPYTEFFAGHESSKTIHALSIAFEPWLHGSENVTYEFMDIEAAIELHQIEIDSVEATLAEYRSGRLEDDLADELDQLTGDMVSAWKEGVPTVADVRDASSSAFQYAGHQANFTTVVDRDKNLAVQYVYNGYDFGDPAREYALSDEGLQWHVIKTLEAIEVLGDAAVGYRVYVTRDIFEQLLERDQNLFSRYERVGILEVVEAPLNIEVEGLPEGYPVGPDFEVEEPAQPVSLKVFIVQPYLEFLDKRMEAIATGQIGAEGDKAQQINIWQNLFADARENWWKQGVHLVGLRPQDVAVYRGELKIADPGNHRPMSLVTGFPDVHDPQYVRGAQDDFRRPVLNVSGGKLIRRIAESHGVAGIVEHYVQVEDDRRTQARFEQVWRKGEYTSIEKAQRDLIIHRSEIRSDANDERSADQIMPETYQEKQTRLATAVIDPIRNRFESPIGPWSRGTRGFVNWLRVGDRFFFDKYGYTSPLGMKTQPSTDYNRFFIKTLGMIILASFLGIAILKKIGELQTGFPLVIFASLGLLSVAVMIHGLLGRSYTILRAKELSQVLSVDNESAASIESELENLVFLVQQTNVTDEPAILLGAVHHAVVRAADVVLSPERIDEFGLIPRRQVLQMAKDLLNNPHNEPIGSLWVAYRALMQDGLVPGLYDDAFDIIRQFAVRGVRQEYLPVLEVAKLALRHRIDQEEAKAAGSNHRNEHLIKVGTEFLTPTIVTPKAQDWGEPENISEELVREVLDQYDLGEYQAHAVAGGGYNNRGFWVETDQGEYFLKIQANYGNRVEELSAHEMRMNHFVNEQASERGYRWSTPYLYAAKNDKAFVRAQKKNFMIYEFVPGDFAGWGESGGARLAPTATMMTELHAILADYPHGESIPQSNRENAYHQLDEKIKAFEQARDQIADRRARRAQTNAEVAFMHRVGEFIEGLLAIKEQLSPDGYAGLPKQLVHFDLAPIHIQYSGDVAHLIIDWEMATIDTRAIDFVKGLAPFHDRNGYDEFLELVADYQIAAETTGNPLEVETLAAIPHIHVLHRLSLAQSILEKVEDSQPREGANVPNVDWEITQMDAVNELTDFLQEVDFPRDVANKIEEIKSRQPRVITPEVSRSLDLLPWSRQPTKDAVEGSNTEVSPVRASKDQDGWNIQMAVSNNDYTSARIKLPFATNVDGHERLRMDIDVESAHVVERVNQTARLKVELRHKGRSVHSARSLDILDENAIEIDIPNNLGKVDEIVITAENVMTELRQVNFTVKSIVFYPGMDFDIQDIQEQYIEALGKAFSIWGKSWFYAFRTMAKMFLLLFSLGIFMVAMRLTLAAAHKQLAPWVLVVAPIVGLIFLAIGFLQARAPVEWNERVRELAKERLRLRQKVFGWFDESFGTVDPSLHGVAQTEIESFAERKSELVEAIDEVNSEVIASAEFHESSDFDRKMEMISILLEDLIIDAEHFLRVHHEGRDVLGDLLVYEDPAFRKAMKQHHGLRQLYNYLPASIDFWQLLELQMTLDELDDKRSEVRTAKLVEGELVRGARDHLAYQSHVVSASSEILRSNQAMGEISRAFLNVYDDVADVLPEQRQMLPINKRYVTVRPALIFDGEIPWEVHPFSTQVLVDVQENAKELYTATILLKWLKEFREPLDLTETDLRNREAQDRQSVTIFLLETLKRLGVLPIRVDRPFDVKATETQIIRGAVPYSLFTHVEEAAAYYQENPIPLDVFNLFLLLMDPQVSLQRTERQKINHQATEGLSLIAESLSAVGRIGMSAHLKAVGEGTTIITVPRTESGGYQPASVFGSQMASFLERRPAGTNQLVLTARSELRTERVEGKLVMEAREVIERGRPQGDESQALFELANSFLGYYGVVQDHLPMKHEVISYIRHFQSSPPVLAALGIQDEAIISRAGVSNRDLATRLAKGAAVARAMQGIYPILNFLDRAGSEVSATDIQSHLVELLFDAQKIGMLPNRFERNSDVEAQERRFLLGEIPYEWLTDSAVRAVGDHYSAFAVPLEVLDFLILLSDPEHSVGNRDAQPINHAAEAALNSIYSSLDQVSRELLWTHLEQIAAGSKGFRVPARIIRPFPKAHSLREHFMRSDAGTSPRVGENEVIPYALRQRPANRRSEVRYIRTPERFTKEFAEQFAEQIRYFSWLGRPGSGKGTLMKKFISKLNALLPPDKQYEALVLGDFIRAVKRYHKLDSITRNAEEETEFQALIDKGIYHLNGLLTESDLELMTNGGLLDDELIIRFVNAILQLDQFRNAHGVVFDGFARTVPQGEALEKGRIHHQDKPIQMDFNIIMDIEEKIIFDRAAKRFEEEGRDDDEPKTVRKRLKEYREKTEPYVEYKRQHADTRHMPGTLPGDLPFHKEISMKLDIFTEILYEYLNPGKSPELEAFLASPFNFMQDGDIVEGQDIGEAGDLFAVSLLREEQRVLKNLDEKVRRGEITKEQAVMIEHMATGNTPWIGYTKKAEVLKTWNTPETQAWLRRHGLDTHYKPDMRRVIVHPLDALFPQKRTDYHSFANILDNMFAHLGIPEKNRHLFYGDVKNEEGDPMSDASYKALMDDVNEHGLLIDEFLKMKFLKKWLYGDLGKPLESLSKRKQARVKQYRRLQEKFRSHPDQKQYFEALYAYSHAMAESLKKQGGAHVFISGVGPSHEGKGHIGFMEAKTPFDQGLLMGIVGFHMASDHMKEEGGMGKLWTAHGKKKFGFVTYGFDELLKRQGDSETGEGRVKVLGIATGIQKAEAMHHGIQKEPDTEYPISRLQDENVTWVLDKFSARNLRYKTHPWDFKKIKIREWTDEMVANLFITLSKELEKPIEELTVTDFLQNSKHMDHMPIKRMRRQNYENLMRSVRGRHANPKKWAELRDRVVTQIKENLTTPEGFSQRLHLKPGSKITFINPHLDDDVLAAYANIKQLIKEGHDVSVYFTAPGYTAVHTSYAVSVLKKLESMAENNISHIRSLIEAAGNEETFQLIEKQLLGELVAELEKVDIHKPMKESDYDVWGIQSDREQELRTQLLILRLAYQNKQLAKKLKTLKGIKGLNKLLNVYDKSKPGWGSEDLDVMKEIKVILRFAEEQTPLLRIFVPYENIHYPLNATWYGTIRSGAVKDEDVDEVTEVLLREKPDVVVIPMEEFGDAGAHDSTKRETIKAIMKIRERRKGFKPKILGYRGVWDRTPTNAQKNQASVMLTQDDLDELDFGFEAHFRTQSRAKQPVPDSGFTEPVSFSKQVIMNAEDTKNEIEGLVGQLPEGVAGVLNFNFYLDLDDPKAQDELQEMLDELDRMRGSVERSSTLAVNGPIPHGRPNVRQVFKLLREHGLAIEDVFNDNEIHTLFPTAIPAGETSFKTIINDDYDLAAWVEDFLAERRRDESEVIGIYLNDRWVNLSNDFYKSIVLEAGDKVRIELLERDRPKKRSPKDRIREGIDRALANDDVNGAIRIFTLHNLVFYDEEEWVEARKIARHYNGPVKLVGKKGGTGIIWRAVTPAGFISGKVKKPTHVGVDSWETLDDIPQQGNRTHEVMKRVVDGMMELIDEFGPDRVMSYYLSTAGFFNPDGSLAGPQVNVKNIPAGFHYTNYINNRLAERLRNRRHRKLGKLEGEVVHDGTGHANGERSIYGAFPWMKKLYVVVPGTGVATRFIDRNGNSFTGGPAVNELHNESPHQLVWMNGHYEYIIQETEGYHPDFKNKTIPEFHPDTELPNANAGQPNPYYKHEDMEDRTSGGGITRFVQIEMRRILKHPDHPEYHDVQKLIEFAGGQSKVTSKQVGQLSQVNNAFARRIIKSRSKELGMGIATALIESNRIWGDEEFPLSEIVIALGGHVVKNGDFAIEAVRQGAQKIFAKAGIEFDVHLNIQPSHIDDEQREFFGGFPSMDEYFDYQTALTSTMRSEVRFLPQSTYLTADVVGVNTVRYRQDPLELIAINPPKRRYKGSYELDVPGLEEYKVRVFYDHRPGYEDVTYTIKLYDRETGFERFSQMQFIVDHKQKRIYGETFFPMFPRKRLFYFSLSFFEQMWALSMLFLIRLIKVVWHPKRLIEFLGNVWSVYGREEYKPGRGRKLFEALIKVYPGYAFMLSPYSNTNHTSRAFQDMLNKIMLETDEAIFTAAHTGMWLIRTPDYGRERYMVINGMKMPLDRVANNPLNKTDVYWDISSEWSDSHQHAGRVHAPENPSVYHWDFRLFKGGLDEVPMQEFMRLRESGVDTIWLDGVYGRSKYSQRVIDFYDDLSQDGERVGRTDSNYSIHSYAVRDEIGGDEALKAFSDLANQFGISVSVGFVPHMAADNPLLAQHPEMFVQPNRIQRQQSQTDLLLAPENAYQGAEYFLDVQSGLYFRYQPGALTPDGKPVYWQDGVQINWAHPKAQAYFGDVIRRLAYLTNGGGLRLDAFQQFGRPFYTAVNADHSLDVDADYTSTKQFFTRLFAELTDQYPGILLIGENFDNADPADLYRMGMTHTYGTNDDFAFVNRDRPGERLRTAAEVREWLKAFVSSDQHRLLHLENHDYMARAANAEFGLGHDRALAATVILQTLPSATMIVAGQERGHSQWVPSATFVAGPEEAADREIESAYKTLGVITTAEAFRQGGIQFLDYHMQLGARHVIAYERGYGASSRVVVVNYSDQPTYVKIGRKEQSFAPWGAAIYERRSDRSVKLIERFQTSPLTVQRSKRRSEVRLDLAKLPEELKRRSADLVGNRLNDLSRTGRNLGLPAILLDPTTRTSLDSVNTRNGWNKGKVIDRYQAAVNRHFTSRLTEIAAGREPTEGEIKMLVDVLAVDDVATTLLPVPKSKTEREVVLERIQILQRAWPTFSAWWNEYVPGTPVPTDTVWRVYIPFSQWIVDQKRKKRPDELYVVGVYGSQGRGKTVTSRALVPFLNVLMDPDIEGQAVARAVDDYYKTQEDRDKLKEKGYDPGAEGVSNRGPAGTHYTEWIWRNMRQMARSAWDSITHTGNYSKKIDNQPEDAFTVEGKVGIFLFDGWFTGADTSFNLADLPDGFKKTVGKELKQNYKRIFDRMDALWAFDTPSVTEIFQNRERQEVLLGKREGKRGMTTEAIRKFVDYFYRRGWHSGVTSPIPPQSGVTFLGTVDKNRRISKVETGNRPVAKQKRRRKQPKDESEKWHGIHALDGKVLVHEETGRVKFASDHAHKNPVVELEFERWVVRHGKTPANASNSLQGMANDPYWNQLDEEGEEQAARAARQILANAYLVDKIRKGKFVLRASPLRRNKKTAQIIARIINDRLDSNVKVIIKRELREINYGDLDSREEDDFSVEEAEAVREYRASNATVRMPSQGSESFRDVLERRRAGLEADNEEFGGTDVVVMDVVHGVSYAADEVLLGHDRIANSDREILFREVKIKNAALTLSSLANPNNIKKPREVSLGAGEGPTEIVVNGQVIDIKKVAKGNYAQRTENTELLKRALGIESDILQVGGRRIAFDNETIEFWTRADRADLSGLQRRLEGTARTLDFILNSSLSLGTSVEFVGQEAIRFGDAAEIRHGNGVGFANRLNSLLRERYEVFPSEFFAFGYGGPDDFRVVYNGKRFAAKVDDRKQALIALTKALEEIGVKVTKQRSEVRLVPQQTMKHETLLADIAASISERVLAQFGWTESTDWDADAVADQLNDLRQSGYSAEQVATSVRSAIEQIFNEAVDEQTVVLRQQVEQAIESGFESVTLLLNDASWAQDVNDLIVLAQEIRVENSAVSGIQFKNVTQTELAEARTIRNVILSIDRPTILAFHISEQDVRKMTDATASIESLFAFAQDLATVNQFIFPQIKLPASLQAELENIRGNQNRLYRHVTINGTITFYNRNVTDLSFLDSFPAMTVSSNPLQVEGRAFGSDIYADTGRTIFFDTDSIASELYLASGVALKRKSVVWLTQLEDGSITRARSRNALGNAFGLAIQMITRDARASELAASAA